MRIVADRVGEVRQRDSEGRRFTPCGIFIISVTLSPIQVHTRVLEMPYSRRSISENLCLLTGTLFLFGILSPKDFVF